MLTTHHVQTKPYSSEHKNVALQTTQTVLEKEIKKTPPDLSLIKNNLNEIYNNRNKMAFLSSHPHTKDALKTLIETLTNSCPDNNKDDLKTLFQELLTPPQQPDSFIQLRDFIKKNTDLSESLTSNIQSLSSQKPSILEKADTATLTSSSDTLDAYDLHLLKTLEIQDVSHDPIHEKELEILKLDEKIDEIQSKQEQVLTSLKRETSTKEFKQKGKDILLKSHDRLNELYTQKTELITTLITLTTKKLETASENKDGMGIFNSHQELRTLVSTRNENNETILKNIRKKQLLSNQTV